MTGDIVLINCAECMHMGDIIGYIFTNMKEKDYLNFGTYSIDYALQEKFNKLDWTSPDAVKRAHEIIEPTHSLPEKWKDGDTGWYVDKSPEHFSLLPFCAAIHRTDLEALSGFDERFGKGIGYADTDFVIRLKHLGLNAQVILDPFCVHQAHTPTIYEKTKFALNGELIASLQKDFPNRIKAEHNKIYNK
jgi:GT2 family glycosyltransferase